jgi:hypothetical protein
MAFPNDNRTIIAIGAGLVVVAAVVLGLVFAGGGDKTPEAPPASKGGLNIDLAEAPVLETTRELRCFVNGQFIGMATLADCARRNGLATDALDVGLDETGALAAAPTAAFAPPPAAPVAETRRRDVPTAATPTDAHPDARPDRRRQRAALACATPAMSGARSRPARPSASASRPSTPASAWAVRATPSTAAGATRRCGWCRAGWNSRATTAVSACWPNRTAAANFRD